MYYIHIYLYLCISAYVYICNQTEAGQTIIDYVPKTLMEVTQTQTHTYTHKHTHTHTHTYIYKDPHLGNIYKEHYSGVMYVYVYIHVCIKKLTFSYAYI